MHKVDVSRLRWLAVLVYSMSGYAVGANLSLVAGSMFIFASILVHASYWLERSTRYV